MDKAISEDWKDISDSTILASLAIQAALSADWQKAAKINQKILKSAKDNIEALNRLAHAWMCLGQKDKAQKLYKQVLTIDPYNLIARKNIDKLTRTNGTNGHTKESANGYQATSPTSIFLFEPGKTKIISLLNLAPPAILCLLNCGDRVVLNPKKHGITVLTVDEIHLGALPDDLAHRLLSFIAGGNQYECYVKSISPKNLTIFIRETYRSQKFLNQPSFLDNRQFLTDNSSSF